MLLEPGQVLSNKYEIVEAIGRGTVCEVYKAHQRDLDRDVVVKVVIPRIVLDKALFTKLVGEIERVARLEHHPHIAWILDLDKDGKYVFFVTDYYPDNLKALLAREGRLPPERAVEIAKGMLRALAFAHENGILHRDIKPSNVLLAPDGRAVLGDFGLGEVARAAVQKLKITQLMPSPVYLAPEHIRSPRSIDERADVYSVAAVLYEMLTGQPPFKGDIRMIYSMKFLGKVPDLGRVAPWVPDQLARVVMKGMAPRPEDRYPSAQEMLAEFEETQEEAVIYTEHPFRLELYPPKEILIYEGKVSLPQEPEVEVRSLRAPLAVATGSRFGLELALSGQGEIRAVLVLPEGFSPISPLVKDLALRPGSVSAAVWEASAPEVPGEYTLEIKLIRGQNPLIGEPIRLKLLVGVPRK